MDVCHLKKAVLEPKFQKYEGQAELRGDIVKDDSGSYAVFTASFVCIDQENSRCTLGECKAELEDCTGEQERIRISDLSKCYETVTWHGEIPR